MSKRERQVAPASLVEKFAEKNGGGVPLNLQGELEILESEALDNDAFLGRLARAVRKKPSRPHNK